jgi:hypothetical protein
VRRGARTALLSVAAGLMLLGCSARFDAFPFLTADGARIELWQSRRQAEEAIFKPSASQPTTPLYTLAQPVDASAEGLSFAFSYASTTPVSLAIFSDKGKTLKSAALPATGGTVLRYLVSLRKGDRIWGYQLSSPSPGGSLQLKAAGTAALVHGFSIDGDTLSVDGSVEVLSASQTGVTARLTPETRAQMETGDWVIGLVLAGDSPGGRVKFTGADGESAVFNVSPTASLSRLDFARGSMGFLPREALFEGALKSFEISTVPAEAPIPADPGEILTWSQASWRRPDFELFSWDRFPKVLIFDTASYTVQDGLFNRLAFFVEKAGHAGTIEQPSMIEGIHGYNAHDYKADDLARFFSEAQKQGAALTAGEQELVRILVENQIIVKNNSGYAPGEGCVISISRSSSSILRELLLTHESFHGAFFSLPTFRDATEKEWASLAPVEQQVWLQFLASKAYDTTDHYLVINEFQAYLLQQERLQVPEFQSVTLSRMREASARGASLVRSLLSSHRSSFTAAFEVLDAALQSEGGPAGGDSAAVRLEQ